ncbi:L-threonylcarbamoyladenylate synthase [Mucilaginibacter myungsuensis]|uniref:L-threonylcarbamoyladenylate synthase n=1 Tax=Mucilaginibacter myungsuensis TaxID=649104 RepID=A0A929KYR7_9SPHI|nr:L-threonylcarbamoyladenylate synthase [Mucilaginibacter myungsuensis]MBE9662393.1 threonylcarbamoyl-AMP synthase [Mucilaginibacter myungsuensis]MDN3599170.1 L-threonylcarbamoyladenylate synthase [Mucilaginibacter myungsuensis]
MLRDEIAKALKVLQNGGIILYPTDTIWGIGCDASNTEAVKKIYALKQREESKSMIILLDVDNKLQSYVNDVPEIAYDLMEYAEHPLTLVMPGAKNISPALIAEDGSIGVRVTNHEFCKQLIQRLRKPLVSTSANISGEPSPKNFGQISPEIIDGVDYVVDLEQHDMGEKRPSTIMRLQPDGRFEFLRR